VILKHLPVLSLNRVDDHHSVQIYLLGFCLTPDQIRLPQQNDRSHPHLGVSGSRPHYLGIGSFRKNNPFWVFDQFFSQGK
jgi:hypothetical protein